MANKKKTPVVCVCGSTTFVNEIAIYKWEREIKENVIIIGLHLMPPQFIREKYSDYAERNALADHLNQLHLRKIDLADEVFIFNKNGYIGEQTAREIEYAKKKKKTIYYLEALNDTNQE